MRVAVTVFGSTISPLCDAARRIMLVEIIDGEIRRLDEQEVGGLDVSGRLMLLSKWGARALICGAISGFLRHALDGRGVGVYPWVTGEVDEVLRVFAARIAREAEGGPERIAVTATGPSLEDRVAPSFGRCSHHLVVEPGGARGDKLVEVISDGLQPGWACTEVAHRLVLARVNVVLTGRCGPNAQGLLAAGGVEVVLGVEGQVVDAIRLFIQGRRGQPAPGATRGRRGRGGGAGRRRRGGQR